jgi:type I restriction enzyme S subunit
MPDLPELFDDGSLRDGCSTAYLGCRDHWTKRDARAALERAWTRCGHLCPERPGQFIDQFRRDFHARAWELWLMSVFSDAGLALERPPPRGPDIVFRLAMGARCWVEAVVPRPGEGPDAVFQRPPGPWCGALYPESNILLRYRSAIEEKLRKIDAYRRDGVVAAGDICIIAVYQGAILDSDLHDHEIPAVARAVLGIGETVLVVTPYSEDPPRVEVPQRESIKKANDAVVTTTTFLESRSSSVAGLLFVNQAVWNLPWSAAEALGVLHNPMATEPLPVGALPCQCELWVESGVLRHRGRCADYGVYS